MRGRKVNLNFRIKETDEYQFKFLFVQGERQLGQLVFLLACREGRQQGHPRGQRSRGHRITQLRPLR